MKSFHRPTRKRCPASTLFMFRHRDNQYCRSIAFKSAPRLSNENSYLVPAFRQRDVYQRTVDRSVYSIWKSCLRLTCAIMVGVTLMVMYEDESVEVRYGDGSCLQLSACGSEFVLEKSLPSSAHPLQLNEKVRQRTRFATSIYKLMIQALEFRNRYATRPYLPEELIPAHCRMYLPADISEVEWPSLNSCGLEFGSKGEAIITSVDGNASLLLSPSREEFTVEFICRASQNEALRAVNGEPETKPISPHVNHQDVPSERPAKIRQTVAESATVSEVEGNGQRCAGPKNTTCVGSTKVEPKEAHLCTRVVQHHSRSCPPPVWQHPLSLALSRWSSQELEPDWDNMEEGAGVAGRACPSGPWLPKGQRCRLPEALPVRCPSPHQHSWNFRDVLQRSEEDLEQGLRTELVKVMWCQGVVYRLINGAVTIIEISPGDGSVIRSNGAVANYFTHHLAGLAPGQGEEGTYFVNSLPPDIPGQVYSVSTVVSRASRILKCYHQARLSLMLPNTHGCWREESGYSDNAVLIQEAHVEGSGHFMAFSDGRVHVVFLDRVTLQMMWNFSASAAATQESGGLWWRPRGAWPQCGWCQLTLADGQRQLLQLQAPGPHGGYVSAAVEWCHWVEKTKQNKGGASCAVQSAGPGRSWSVVAELEKIKRFNFLLEHSGLLRTPGGSAGLRCRSWEAVSCSEHSVTPVEGSESSIEEALQRTSRTIQDIEALLSDRTSTEHSAA
ncbi:uncharacterized protein C5orf34 homolog [Megalops cyprinoides]|uniref:uncharacterized protein C5orf34 homolog n=1 Tax=Megalops cyprinoides TaxID=118141 RepID=UPI0018644454|nr:uncharacterized protein C5orf34 homolog [Megalops cyprinoides]